MKKTGRREREREWPGSRRKRKQNDMPKNSSGGNRQRAEVLPFDEPDLARRLEALDEGLGFIVRTTHRMFWRALEDRLAEHGITPEMWTYLRVLWREEGLSLKRLAERLNLEGPTVGTAIRIMERRGLVVRKRNRKDGREWCVHLRPRGRYLEAKLLPIAEQTNASAKAGLSPEQIASVKNVLLHMQRNLRRLAMVREQKGRSPRDRGRPRTPPLMSPQIGESA